jgi:hypothetical protein
MTNDEIDDVFISIIKSFLVGRRAHNPELYRAIFRAGMLKAAEIADVIGENYPHSSEGWYAWNAAAAIRKEAGE